MKTGYKFSTVIFLLFVSFTVLQARQVDLEKALQTAKTHVQTQSQLKSSPGEDIRLAYVSTGRSALKSANNENAIYYYVFNIGNDNGFVIIAGDDVAKPVLGYSNDGKYDNNKLPPNFSYWMNCLREEISYAIENGITPDEETNADWKAYSEENVTLKANAAVAPLISTKWGQDEPYNQLCPNYKTGKRSVTGCVATAMAQLMKFYKYPATGKGSSEAYTTDQYKIKIPAVDLSTGYDWKNMTDTYTSSSTSVESAAVAKLMYHCGVTVQMDYCDGSGASVYASARAFTGYFNYDKSLQVKPREYITESNKRYLYYSDAEWSSMIKNEIDAGRPVLYTGMDSDDEGHAFICDGYDNSGKFRFNWGWEGWCDGYFALNALNPGTGGAGAGSGVYNIDQRIIVGLRPNMNGTENYEIKIVPENPMKSSKSSVNKGEAFVVNAQFSNEGYNDFTGFFGMALTDASGKILEIIGTYNSDEWSLQAGYYFSESLPFACAVSDKIPLGTYKIRPVVKPSYGGWSIVSGAVESVDVLNLEVKSNGVEKTASLQIYKTAITPDKKPIEKNKPLAVKVGIANSASSAFIGDIDLGIYSLSGELLQTIESRRLDINASYYYICTFHSSEITVPPGNYKLTLYAKPAVGQRKIIASSGSLLNGIDVTVTGPSGIDNVTGGAFTVYPNPVNEVLHLQANDNQLIKSIKLNDLSGRTIKSILYEQCMTQIDIPVNGLSSGIYLLLIQTEKNIITEKFLKK